MPRRASNLYELVEPEELMGDGPAAAAQTVAPADDRVHRRSPRVGVGVALICGVIVAVALVAHLRHGAAEEAGVPALPVAAEAPRATVAGHRHSPQASPVVRRRAHHPALSRRRAQQLAPTRRRIDRPRPGSRHLLERPRPAVNTTVTTVTSSAPRQVRATRPVQRPRLTPAEMEFGIEH